LSAPSTSSLATGAVLIASRRCQIQFSSHLRLESSVYVNPFSRSWPRLRTSKDHRSRSDDLVLDHVTDSLSGCSRHD
jgi:hypothetical protein